MKSLVVSAVLISAMFLSTFVVRAQVSERSINATYGPNLLYALVLPSGIREGYAVRNFVASAEFATLRKEFSDRELLDEIYYTSLAATHGTLSSGLLAAAFGSFEHEAIPLHFLGINMKVPLTSEPHERFKLRQSHLPQRIYSSDMMDVDKPQHFFASAWLKQTLGMDWLCNLAGEFVESFESAFVLGSGRDPRDIHANHDGIRFSAHASEHKTSAPEDDLTPNP